MIPHFTLCCPKCGKFCEVKDGSRMDLLTHPEANCPEAGKVWRVWLDPIGGYVRVDETQRISA